MTVMMLVLEFPLATQSFGDHFVAGTITVQEDHHRLHAVPFEAGMIMTMDRHVVGTTTMVGNAAGVDHGLPMVVEIAADTERGA